MWTEGWENLMKGGDEHHEQFSNTEIWGGGGGYSLGTKLKKRGRGGEGSE
jgi:hypothetical protein